MSVSKSLIENPPQKLKVNNRPQVVSIRKQSVIMFTDIAGFTEMIGENEERTLEIIAENRRIQQFFIHKNDGCWIKEMGDGVLSSFNASCQAIKCALDIQKAVKAIPDLRLHIGIHQSKVVFIGDDVFGLGVNIAFRLQKLACPGQILVSESVVRNLHKANLCHTEFISDKKLRNVKRSIRIYKVCCSNEHLE